MQRQESETFMNIPMIIFLFILIAGGLLGLEIYRELHHFRVTHYTIESQKFKGFSRDLNLIFLSDLHNRVYGEKNEPLLQAIRNEKPDLILIGGDMLVGKEDASYDIALDFTSQLPEIAPVLYATGNHEQRMREKPEIYQAAYADYRQQLKDRGVLFLENGSCRIEAGTVLLEISGVELPSASYKKLKKLPIQASDIAEYLHKDSVSVTEDSVYRILLAHNPAYMNAYKGWGADLILSGHLHGGVMRLPGIGGVITPQAFLFPKYSGEMTKEGEQTIIVSRGLGTHTINIRLFNQPEVVSICLKRSENKK
ncbi:MAG: metallophosphoesterase [[Ruminococcus] lactaris]|nr:metallophosphoesterase [[Ruminococcus] lactaris]